MAFVQRLAIHTADPRSVCWAGGNLEGEVTLVLTDPTLITGIRLSYRCEAHLDYMDNGQEVEVEHEEEEDETEEGRRHKKKKFLETVALTPKRRMATEKFLETTSILWGTGPTASYGEVMPSGYHALAFDIQVPQDLPGSFEGRHGFVRHWLECLVDRPGAPAMATKKALSVISYCDLNKDPLAMKPIRHREEVILCWGCIRPDRYDVSYELPYRGYVPGETMFPDVRIRNFTRNPIIISVRLQMITTYKTKTRRKIITRVVAHDRKLVHKAELTKWEPSVQVPALPPTGLGGCNIIDVRYVFEVELTSHGVGWQGLAFQDEVLIGTIPLQDVAQLRRQKLALQPISAKMAFLLKPAFSASQLSTSETRGSFLPANRASSNSTGDGKVISDADSISPLANSRDTRRTGHRNQRSASIISNSSHWSFHPMKPHHRGFHWKQLLGKGNPKKAYAPKPLPTIYRC